MGGGSMPEFPGQNSYALAVFGGAGVARGLRARAAGGQNGRGRRRGGRLWGWRPRAGAGPCPALAGGPPARGPPLLALAGLLALLRAVRSELVARAAAAVLARV